MREEHKRHSSGDLVAGHDLLDPRGLVRSGVAIAGALGAGLESGPTSAAAEPLKDGPWVREPGSSVKSHLTPFRVVTGLHDSIAYKSASQGHGEGTPRPA